MRTVPEGSAVATAAEHEWVASTRTGTRRRARSASPISRRTASATSCSCSCPTSASTWSPGPSVSEIESTKSVSDVYVPLTGVVSAVNDALADQPELVNPIPYGAGWMFEIELPTRPRSTACSTPPRTGRCRSRVEPQLSTFTLWLRSSVRVVGFAALAGSLTVVLCARCGHQNPEDARFCSSCGAPLGAADEETTLTLSAVEAADRGGRARALPRRAARRASACSSCATVPNAGSSYRLDDVGAPRSAAIPTPTSSSTTSPCRAATSWSTATDDGYTLRDVGSLNGTYVNRKRVDEAPLRYGDEVQIGRYRLSFVARRRAGRLMMAKRAHSSIGDVLNQLRDEFPDITISKIRFLESQGLVDPERTPSGYRKFYPADVERLRFILREQREHFLPLKVIKERLDEVDADGGFTVAEAGRSRRRPIAWSIPRRSTRCSRRRAAPRRAPKRDRHPRRCATTTRPRRSRGGARAA